VALCVGLLCVAGGCGQGQATRRPLIGITSAYEPAKQERSARTAVSFNYVSAVAENGGVPIVLPAVDDERVLQRYVDILDGLVLTGGDDIPPEAYGEQMHETTVLLSSQRYEFERKLIARWLASGKPVLGVCLGMQFANVVAGGSLIQDIPSEVGTAVNHRKPHRVAIVSPSRLARVLDANDVMVLSTHHQAVDGLGQGLKVVARSGDGVIEALERTDGPFGLFVQWHPEAMSDPTQRNAIYGALIRACMRAH
jgi:putative glutamine amidotransferase